MEQLIFVGLIVVFSILDALARKQRARQQGQGPLPGDWPDEAERAEGWSAEERAPPVGTVPPSYDEDASYDEEPSYDDGVLSEGGRVARPAPPDRRGGARRADERRGSEGLIPSEIWEEIQALARGEVPRKPEPEPAPEPQSARVPPPVRVERRHAPAESAGGESPSAEAPGRRRRVEPVPYRAPHPVHTAHERYGTPVSARLTPPAQVERGARTAAAADAVAALRGGREALRRAVILQEVLGPPVSLREESGP